jgi:predicted transcriptional regulator
MDTEQNHISLIELTTDIVANYVAHNAISPTELSNLIHTTFQALSSLENGATVSAPEEPLVPAVSVKKSVQADYIVCLEDGKHFKSLKRHLRTSYDMTPDEYRARWGLPHDYPMVAPNYSAARSTLAKTMGLGNTRKKPGRKKV